MRWRIEGRSLAVLLALGGCAQDHSAHPTASDGSRGADGSFAGGSHDADAVVDVIRNTYSLVPSWRAWNSHTDAPAKTAADERDSNFGGGPFFSTTAERGSNLGRMGRGSTCEGNIRSSTPLGSPM